MNIVWRAVWYMTVRGLAAGAGLGALYGTLLFPLIGTAYGALYGGIFGLLSGIGCGLLVALFTSAFDPISNLLNYQRVMTLGCAILAFVTTYLGCSRLLGTALTSISLPPAFIASCAATYVALGFAAECASGKFEKPKRKRDTGYV
jgi:hypothetical protein